VFKESLSSNGEMGWCPEALTQGKIHNSCPSRNRKIFLDHGVQRRYHGKNHLWMDTFQAYERTAIMVKQKFQPFGGTAPKVYEQRDMIRRVEKL
jgi:hypothetical protein